MLNIQQQKFYLFKNLLLLFGLQMVHGSALTGNLYIKLQQQIRHYPKENLIDNWDWTNVDISKEAQGVLPKEIDSIQYKVLEKLKSEDFDIIYDDDGSGEIADIITIKLYDDKIKIKMYHLKYAHAGTISSRVDNMWTSSKIYSLET